jgi:hypothetical protein
MGRPRSCSSTTRWSSSATGCGASAAARAQGQRDDLQRLRHLRVAQAVALGARVPGENGKGRDPGSAEEERQRRAAEDGAEDDAAGGRRDHARDEDRHRPAEAALGQETRQIRPVALVDLEERHAVFGAEAAAQVILDLHAPRCPQKGRGPRERQDERPDDERDLRPHLHLHQPTSPEAEPPGWPERSLAVRMDVAL